MDGNDYVQLARGSGGVVSREREKRESSVGLAFIGTTL